MRRVHCAVDQKSSLPKFGLLPIRKRFPVCNTLKKPPLLTQIGLFLVKACNISNNGVRATAGKSMDLSTDFYTRPEHVSWNANQVLRRGGVSFAVASNAVRRIRCKLDSSIRIKSPRSVNETLDADLFEILNVHSK